MANASAEVWLHCFVFCRYDFEFWKVLLMALCLILHSFYFIRVLFKTSYSSVSTCTYLQSHHWDLDSCQFLHSLLFSSPLLWPHNRFLFLSNCLGSDVYWHVMEGASQVSLTNIHTASPSTYTGELCLHYLSSYSENQIIWTQRDPRSLAVAVRLCDKCSFACSHKGANGVSDRWKNSVIPCSGCYQTHKRSHRSHPRPISTCPEKHRYPKAGENPNWELRGEDALSRPLPECLRWRTRNLHSQWLITVLLRLRGKQDEVVYWSTVDVSALCLCSSLWLAAYVYRCCASMCLLAVFVQSCCWPKTQAGLPLLDCDSLILAMPDLLH